MASKTRQRLIQTALDLFYREGFHAVGLDRIIAEVGVTKTTFYNHFPSKDDLIVAVVEAHGQWWQATFRDMLRQHGGSDARQQLRGVFSVLREVITDKEYRGCIFLNAAIQFPLPHDPAHQASLNNELALQQIIRDVAADAGVEDADLFAEQFMLLMGGAVTRHLLTWDPRAADLAADLADQLIDRYLPLVGGDDGADGADRHVNRRLSQSVL